MCLRNWCSFHYSISLWIQTIWSCLLGHMYSFQFLLIFMNIPDYWYTKLCILLRIKRMFNISDVELLHSLPGCSWCTFRAMWLCTAQRLSLHLLAFKGLDKQYSYLILLCSKRVERLAQQSERWRYMFAHVIYPINAYHKKCIFSSAQNGQWDPRICQSQPISLHETILNHSWGRGQSWHGERVISFCKSSARKFMASPWREMRWVQRLGDFL